MAVYRSIHVSFWQDEFILDLEPDEKYFYLYLMTNSKTTQCGIYELPKKLMVLETGYPMDTLSILLKRFIDTEKVLYSEDTREIFLLNWLKHNSIKSPKVLSCVEKELKAVKDKVFLSAFADKCIEYGYPIPTVCKEYLEGCKLSLDPYGEEEEEEEEKEGEQEEEEVKPVVVVNPFNFYQENFGVLSPFLSEDIGNWIDDTSEELVTEAMKISLQSQKPWKYAAGILKDWMNHNLKTVADVQAYNKHYENQKVNRTGKVKMSKEDFNLDD
jgi:DnaD/phage-associated family protein